MVTYMVALIEETWGMMLLHACHHIGPKLNNRGLFRV